ncbi:MAG TPA: 2-dehydro-3-deoxy-6-phosphogalactonate aldolase, partial [Thalassobaculum sp.]
PAEAAPPPVLKAMLAVLPKGVPVLPVGGIRPESMAAYRQAGAAGFGLGSALYKPGDGPATVRQKALAFRQAFDALRGTASA